MPGRQAFDFAALARLVHRHCSPGTIPEICANKTKDDLLFLLPLHHSRIWIAVDDAVLHDGLVKPGILYLVPPGEAAHIRVQESLEFATLYITRAAILAASRNHDCDDFHSTLTRIPRMIEARHDIQRLVPLLSSTCDSTGPQRTLLASGIALTLLGLLIQADLHRTSRQVAGLEQERFEAAMAFANERLSARLDLAEWAGSVGLSTNDFARRFQQHTGVAPYTWFLDRRIEQAKQMMRDTELRLVEIALDSGFCSQAHFTEAFHRRVGMAPGRWRLLHAEKCPRHPSLKAIDGGNPVASRAATEQPVLRKGA
jgi:AraC family transcriptional regulator